LKNIIIPQNKSLFIVAGIIMILAASLFSLEQEFRFSIGHLILGVFGCVGVLTGWLVDEIHLEMLSRWLIILNILAAIAWFIF
jgi:Protein of unknown function (DUF2964)